MDASLKEALERWRKAGLVTVAQAEAIERYEESDVAATRASPSPASPSQDQPTNPRAEHSPPLLTNRWLHRVIHPGFARRPPFFVSARLVGLLAAALAGLALFVAVINAGTDLLLAPGRLPHELPSLAIQVVAAALGLAGGILMWNGHRRGKRLVVGSLVLDVVGNAVPDPRHLFAIEALLQLALWAAIYYLVVVSRYERLPRPVT
jgi:hypothetical protein